MHINFHGVRGSYPVPSKDTVRYGGNTTCVSITKMVEGKIHRLIFDSGTGIINLGKEMNANFFAGQEKINNIPLFFTHLHPDHIQGFAFFAPNFLMETRITLLGMKTLKRDIGNILEQEMLPPVFPIEYKDLKSMRKNYELFDRDTLYVNREGMVSRRENGPEKKDLFKVQAMKSFAPSHPQQGSMYYIVEDLETNKRVALIWDIESHIGGDKAVIGFARECDIMIHDVMYTEKEYSSEERVVQGFGHSTFKMALENATQARIKKAIIGIHFNPTHSDDFLDRELENIKKESALPFLLAKERTSFEV